MVTLGGIIQESPSLKKTKARIKPMTNHDWYVNVAAGCVGWLTRALRGQELFGDEVYTALKGAGKVPVMPRKVAVLARTAC